jgi:ferric-dicitrate binding protein FerR (iron transport regulator)
LSKGHSRRDFTQLCALVLGAVALLIVPCSMGRAQIAPAPPTGSRIVSLTGNLLVRRQAETPHSLGLNDAVQPGDELITGANAEAVIRTSDGSTVHVFPDSRMIFSEHSPDVQEFLHLFLGSIKVHIEKLSGRPNPHNMTTPTAVIAVRGTTFSVFVDEGDTTLVAVDEGIVSVANRARPSDEMLLQGGQRTWVRGDLPPARAQAFRGRSERADMVPGEWSGRRMRGGMVQSGMEDRMGSASGGASASDMGGMSRRPGPPH